MAQLKRSKSQKEEVAGSPGKTVPRDLLEENYRLRNLVVQLSKIILTTASRS
jgi:hypothetical protein